MFEQLWYLFGVLFADVLQYILAGLFVWLLLDEILSRVKRSGIIERITFHVISTVHDNQPELPELKE